ncbi:hypothetical protein ACYZCU_29610, partial [Klebsiella pneumoniae]
MMSLWDALRMNMMISYQELVRTFPNPETTAASPDMAIPFGLKFSGYARYGAHFQTGDQKYVGVDGSYNGASAIGRLG